MKLDSCTPDNLRSQIREVSEAYSLEELLEDIVLFRKKYPAILKETAGILDEHVHHLDQNRILKPHNFQFELKDCWTIFGILHAFLDRPDINCLEDDTIYEGIEYITRLANTSRNHLRWVLDECDYLQLSKTLQDIELESYRFIMIIFLFWLLEDEEVEDPSVWTDDDLEDDDDEDDDDLGEDDNDGGIEDDDDDLPDLPGTGLYRNSSRSRRNYNHLFAQL